MTDCGCGAGLGLTETTAHTGYVFQVMHDPEHSQVISSSADGTLVVWDVRGEGISVRDTLPCHSNSIFRFAMDARAETIVTGSADSTGTGADRACHECAGSHLIISLCGDGCFRVDGFLCSASVESRVPRTAAHAQCGGCFLGCARR